MSARSGATVWHAIYAGIPVAILAKFWIAPHGDGSVRVELLTVAISIIAGGLILFGVWVACLIELFGFRQRSALLVIGLVGSSCWIAPVVSLCR